MHCAYSFSDFRLPLFISGILYKKIPKEYIFNQCGELARSSFKSAIHAAGMVSFLLMFNG